jgi:hypothetical protein
MKQKDINPLEALQRIKLMMEYDMSKTLSENKIVINEQNTVEIKDIAKIAKDIDYWLSGDVNTKYLEKVKNELTNKIFGKVTKDGECAFSKLNTYFLKLKDVDITSLHTWRIAWRMMPNDMFKRGESIIGRIERSQESNEPEFEEYKKELLDLINNEINTFCKSSSTPNVEWKICVEELIKSGKGVVKNTTTGGKTVVVKSWSPEYPDGVNLYPNNRVLNRSTKEKGTWGCQYYYGVNIADKDSRKRAFISVSDVGGIVIVWDLKDGGGGGGGGGGQSKYKYCPGPRFEIYCINEKIRQLQGCIGATPDSYYGPKTLAKLRTRISGIDNRQNNYIDSSEIDEICSGNTPPPPPPPVTPTPTSPPDNKGESTEFYYVDPNQL